MLAGGAMQYKASTDAAQRAKQQAVQAQQRQLMAQNAATDVAAQRAAQYDPTIRDQNQQQIQGALTQTYDQAATKPQITAQGVQVGTTIPDSQGTADYTLAKAKETAKTTASLHALAGLMGRIGSASTLREGEAVGMGDTAGAIGRIQGGAGNIAGIDQYATQQAGNLNPGMLFAGQMLGAAGKYGMAKSSMPKTQQQYPDYGTSTGGNGAWL
jgi:hypothetical protein